MNARSCGFEYEILLFVVKWIISCCIQKKQVPFVAWCFAKGHCALLPVQSGQFDLFSHYRSTPNRYPVPGLSKPSRNTSAVQYLFGYGMQMPCPSRMFRVTSYIASLS